MALSDLALQARNKVEKHDHQTRDNATRFISQLTPEDHAVLAEESDVGEFRRYLAGCQLRLAEAAALAAKVVIAQAAAPAAQAPTAEEADAADPPAPTLDDTDVE